MENEMTKKKLFHMTGKAMLKFGYFIEATNKKEAIKKFLEGEVGIDHEYYYEYKPSTFRVANKKEAIDD